MYISLLIHFLGSTALSLSHSHTQTSCSFSPRSLQAYLKRSTCLPIIFLISTTLSVVFPHPHTHSFTFTHTNIVQLLTLELSSLFKEKYFPTNPFPEFYRTLHQHHTSNAERNRISDAQIKQVCVYTHVPYLSVHVYVCVPVYVLIHACMHAWVLCVWERKMRESICGSVCMWVCARVYTHTRTHARAHMHTDVLELYLNECRKVLKMRNCVQALQDRADIVYKVRGFIWFSHVLCIETCWCFGICSLCVISISVTIS